MQTQLAAVLDLPQHKLRVVCRSVSTEIPQLFPRVQTCGRWVRWEGALLRGPDGGGGGGHAGPALPPRPGQVTSAALRRLVHCAGGSTLRLPGTGTRPGQTTR